MKLYLTNNNGKIYIRASAPNRKELANKLGGKFLTVNGKKYSVNDVSAEKGNEGTGLGLLVGGVIGALGGPLGVIAGGAIGALLGKEQDTKESNEVDSFNKSEA